MSVTYIEKKKIKLMHMGVKGYLKDISGAIYGNKNFLWRRSYFSGTEEDHMNCILGRLFWYLHVANATAYGLQYQEAIDIDRTDLPDNPHFIGLKELIEQLDHLDYNLSTNDGNRFIHRDWEDLFFKILESLKDKYIREKV